MLYIAEYLVIVHKLYQLEEVSPKWVEYKQSASYVDDIRVFNENTHRTDPNKRQDICCIITLPYI